MQKPVVESSGRGINALLRGLKEQKKRTSADELMVPAFGQGDKNSDSLRNKEGLRRSNTNTLQQP